MSTMLSQNSGNIMLHTAGEDFYQDYMSLLVEGETILAAEMMNMRRDCTAGLGRDPIDHWSMRLKPAASVKNKLKRMGYRVDAGEAVSRLHDVVAARVVCAFIDDIYFIRDWFYRQPSIEIVEEKDYIKHPKPNGYRSCHLIMRLSPNCPGILTEIQLRTLAMDCWASLEHQMKYKNTQITQELITAELKRCSDELASTEWNLLAIREMIEQQMNRNERQCEREEY